MTASFFLLSSPASATSTTQAAWLQQAAPGHAESSTQDRCSAERWWETTEDGMRVPRATTTTTRL